MNSIINYLGKTEGLKLHRNSTESDVTSGYGIYRAVHPDASVWNYIDDIATDIGIMGDSSSWDKDDIARVNSELDPVMVKSYATEFYSKYLKGAHLELFNEDCEIVAMSLYVNAPKLLNSAVQSALLSLQRIGKIDADVKLSVVDGMWGSKTARGLLAANQLVTGKEMKAAVLLGAVSYYTGITVANPDNLRYLQGWINRLIGLSEA